MCLLIETCLPEEAGLYLPQGQQWSVVLTQAQVLVGPLVTLSGHM